MKTKTKTSVSLLRAERLNKLESGKFSLDIITGAQNLTTLSPQDLFDRERPEDIQGSCKMARDWHKNSWFVEAVILLQMAFFNFGLTIRPRRPGKAEKNKLKKWLEDDRNRDGLYRYIETVWEEWLKLDNVVSFWLKQESQTVTPFLLLPETCKYTDALGIEKLIVTLGYKKEQLQQMGKDALSAEMMRRYTTNKIELSEQFGEYFQVLTRGMRGQGMGIPRLYRAFRTLSQCESMEVGESMLAYAGRLVIRFHRMGFEVKSASNAAKQAEYLWKKTRATAIENFFRGVQGFAETTGQFDHKIDYIWTDPKLYDAKKWETIIQRMMWWGGPLAFMLVSKQPSPFLLPILKAQAIKERQRVGRHLEMVINEGFDIGVPVRLGWSNRCFVDPRLAWQMVKDLMQQGPLSMATSLKEADFDPEEESEQKREEAKKENDDALLPKFDPNHGKRPNDPAGRPKGSKNGEGE